MEVLSRFGLWRNFLNNSIQATISAFRSVKNMSVNPKSVEFQQCHAKPHSICFFYHNIKDNDRNLCQDLLAIKNTDSDLKVHALHYANELIRYLYASDFSFKILVTIEKYVWEKSNVAYLLSIRVQTTINHISILTFLCCFLSQYER